MAQHDEKHAAPMNERGGSQEQEGTGERQSKRARLASPAAASTSQPEPQQPFKLDVSLFVRWHSPSGKTKLNHLQLRQISSLESLDVLPKALVKRAYPDDASLPDHVTSSDFYCFTPSKDYLPLPGEIAETEFRLVVHCDGWEHTVLQRGLGAHRDPEKKLLVTVIEFESTPLVLGHVGVRVSLISYPVVSVKKSWLDDMARQVQHNPDFKGLL